MEGKSQSAHWRSTRCASAAAKRTIQKKPRRAHWKARRSQDTLPDPSHCLSACISVCLSTFSSVCFFLSLLGGFFQLKAEEGKPPFPHHHLHYPWCYALIHPWFNLHWSAESHTYHWEQGVVGWGGEPAHCLCMNQGHWKIKADCGEIITDCFCGIILMHLALTKPCLLYTTASLWDDYC